MWTIRHATCSLSTVGDAVGSPLGCPRIAHPKSLRLKRQKKKQQLCQLRTTHIMITPSLTLRQKTAMRLQA